MNDFFKKNKIILLVILLIIFIFLLLIVVFSSLNYLNKNKNVLESSFKARITKTSKQKVKKQKEIDTRPKFYLVLDDVGYNNAMLEKFKELNLLINFAIIPYLSNSMDSYNALIKDNKIILIHFPMQAKYGNSIEDFHIAINDTKDNIISKINKTFKDYPEAKIMNNHMGSLITSNEPIMRIILETLKNNNKYFFDSVTTQKVVSLKIANELGIKVEKRDIFLDSTDTEQAVLASLEEAKKIARKIGNVKVIGHVSSKNTLKVLQEQEKILNKEFEFKNLLSLYGDENL